MTMAHLPTATGAGMALAEPDEITGMAKQLILIANDLRVAGDVPLVLIDKDGIRGDMLTLADELWLIAVRLDDDLFGWRADGPDGANDAS